MVIDQNKNMLQKSGKNATFFPFKISIQKLKM